MERICKTCTISKPLDSNHFRVTTSGFRHSCRVCVTKAAIVEAQTPHGKARIRAWTQKNKKLRDLRNQRYRNSEKGKAWKKARTKADRISGRSKLYSDRYRASDKGKQATQRNKRTATQETLRWQKDRETLNDHYIKHLLISSGQLKCCEITSELIKLKRQQLKLKRHVKKSITSH